MEINPNSADVIASLGWTHFETGRYEEAIPMMERAIRLNPFPKDWYFRGLGLVYYFTGRYEEAIVALKKAIHIQPKNAGTHRDLVVAYIGSGQEEEARAAAAEVLRLAPNFSVEQFKGVWSWGNQEALDRYVDALRKAGLPDGKSSLPLPDKPSIAVLPFVNMSADPEQEYFSDGITDQLIAGLSKVPNLFVIARNSTFTYKGKPVKVQQVAEELEVRYVLEGSVRKSEDKLRVTVQLIDALKGHHLWAEQYDRQMKDVFAVQDDITKQVITALQGKLTAGQEARLWAKGTNNLAAYLKFLEAGSQFTRSRPPRENRAIAMRLYKESISLDPNYAAAYYALARCHLEEAYLRSTGSPEESLAKAIELAEKAINLDESFAPAHALLGYLYTFVREYDKAITLCERALSLEPNSYEVLMWCGWTYRYASLHEEAIRAFNQAIRLNPFWKSGSFRGLAGSYAFLGRHEEAIEAGRKAVEAVPNDPMAHVNLAAAYGIAGREDEARTEAAEVMRIDPNFSLERYEKGANKYRNKADKEMHIGALRKAGLK